VLSYFNLHTHQTHSNQNQKEILNYPVDQAIPSSYYSVSLHPWTLTKVKIGLTADFISGNYMDTNFIAIGECGLDKLCDTSFDLQLNAFRLMIETSEKHEKPLIIHCVKAFDELISLKKEFQPKQPWIIHGFRGKPMQAHQLIQQGFCLSFGPKHNFETIKDVPLWAIFVETDDSICPIEEVYRLIASERNVSVDYLAENTRNNAIKNLNLTI